MKNSLSDLYEKILLSEAQKNDLTSPSNIVVGDLKSNEEAFGEKPEVTKGPEKAKLAQGPAYKISTSSETAPTHGSAPKAKFKGTAPATEEKYDEEVEEMEDEEVIPESEFDEEEDEKESPKKEIKKESYTMSAFETLFKKTLLEQDEQPALEAPETELSDEDLDLESEVETEKEPTEEESEESDEDSEDLISDLKDLQARLGSIIDKLETYSADEDEGEEEEEGSYTGEDFDEEFGDEEEEAPVKESLDRPKLLSSAKGKSLMSKKNKVGKLAPKGGKASAGKFKTQASFKAAPKLQKSKAEVKSTVKKGDFIK